MPDTGSSTSLKNYILKEVRERIVDGRYTAGQRLSENTLARELETSRAPVRDALMTLRSEGLVQVYPQRGTFVFNPTPHESQALCEVSGVYEVGALMLAMEHNHDQLCILLKEKMQLGEMALHHNDMAQWAQADRLFHETIIELSGNSFLADAYRAIGSRIATMVYRMPASSERIASSLAQHRKILSMICQGDISKAAELLRNNNIAVAHLTNPQEPDDIL